MSCKAITRMNLSKILWILGLFEMMFWFLTTSLMLISYYINKHNPSVLNDIQARLGSSKKTAQADAEYRKLLHEWEHATESVGITGALLVLIQLFLIVGVDRKNRCLIFVWIIFYSILGIARIVSISIFPVQAFVRYSSILWIPRVFFIYLAATFVLQITNERLGAEEVLAPDYRRQTDDPREFREGLNYPSFPRSLEFSTRMAGLNRLEHAHPKRWEPTYDAFDSDGRMVTVVDDPVYEGL